MEIIDGLKPAVLVLEDGTVFKGNAIGKIGTTTGEIAFNTGMTGYQEVFTDPSYWKQILIMNTAHIGNYGVHEDEIESEENEEDDSQEETESDNDPEDET